MYIVQNRTIWYTISAILVIGSLTAFLVWGLRFGIDFTGGSLMEVTYPAETMRAHDDVVRALEGVGVAGASVRPIGESGYLIRTPFLTPEEYVAVRAELGGTEVRYDSIGPSIGTELRTRALYAILLVILAIALFIAFAFRKVSKPVSSWKYGLVALVALAHDVVIPVGAFVLLGQFVGAEVDTLFVTALLVVLGFSVHDTIVVFDRVRENLRLNAERHSDEDFETTVGNSVTQTMARSINTSLTTVLALVALYFFGAPATHYFALTLLIGIIAGTYSSIFIGSPLLVTLQKLQKAPTPGSGSRTEASGKKKR